MLFFSHFNFILSPTLLRRRLGFSGSVGSGWWREFFTHPTGDEKGDGPFGDAVKVTACWRWEAASPRASQRPLPPLLGVRIERWIKIQTTLKISERKTYVQEGDNQSNHFHSKVIKIHITNINSEIRGCTLCQRWLPQARAHCQGRWRLSDSLLTYPSD